MPKHFSRNVKEIAKEYRNGKMAEELRGEWAIVITSRPLSFPLVWLFARLGLSPMTVTFSSIILALTMPLSALYLPLSAAGLMVCLSAWLYQVLDCVDGSLARVTGKVSLKGARVDFLADMAQWGLLYLAIGLLADRFFDSMWAWTAIAVMAAWLRLFARVCRDAFTQSPPSPPSSLTPLDIPLVAITGLSGLIPFFALAGSWLGIAVGFLVVYSLLDIVDALWPNIRTDSNEDS